MDEIVTMHRNTGSQEQPVWEKWYPLTKDDAVVMTDESTEDTQQQTVTLKQKIAELKQELATIESQVAELNGDVTQLNSDIGTARYSSNLMTVYDVPAFVRWDSETLNTPYKAGLTTATSGFAFVFGQYSGWQTVVAVTVGIEKIFIHTTGNGVPFGWCNVVSRNQRVSGEQFANFDQVSIEKDTDGLYKLHFYKDGTWIGQIKSAYVTQ